ncbi:MAG: hypothetical protein H6502_00345 [Candidatus Woesearchaeota archaeon]|nr:MAG: hypothetical protein H6502_00345 [Candidatus Woesearchaeota archaeon]
MNAKTIVAYSLMASLLFYAAVTLFGSFSPLISGLLFFIIALLVVNLLLFLTFPLTLREKGMVLLEVLIFCGALSALLFTSFSYQEQTRAQQEIFANIISESDYASELVAYQLTYLSYLTSQVQQYEQNNTALQEEIVAVTKENLNMQQVSPLVIAPPLPPPAEVLVPPPTYYYDDDEEYDDKGEDDD